LIRQRTLQSRTVIPVIILTDSYGRLKTETDPLGFTTSYEYNSTDGSLFKVYNHKNQATTFSYDGFLRTIGYSTPDGVTGSTVYSWTALGTNGLYCMQQSVTGKPVTKTYYDALGRETASTVTLFNGSESRIDKLYDTNGLLSKVSLPFVGTAASNWNTYAYDSYDRPTSITEASGKVTSYSYSGNSVTTTQDGISSKKIFDDFGNLTQASDPGGITSYYYRADGQLSGIEAPGY